MSKHQGLTQRSGEAEERRELLCFSASLRERCSFSLCTGEIETWYQIFENDEAGESGLAPRRLREISGFLRYAGCTTSLPRSMFIPQVQVNSPGLSGVNSTGVVLNAGRSRAMPKSPKTTCSLQLAVSSR